MLRGTAFYRNMTNRQARFYETIFGVLRLIFLFWSCLLFALWCIKNLEGHDPWIIAKEIEFAVDQFAHQIPKIFWLTLIPPILIKLPTVFWLIFVPLQEWQYFRYLFAPLGAFLLMFLNDAFYVEDIYHLPSLRRAARYVFSSLFALFYPRAQIESGRIDGEDPDEEIGLHEQHLLRAIGGPGFARIQPGNAVAFRDWFRDRGIQDNQLYFMRPFEMIARVVNLEDQHGHLEDAAATTRDGIRLRLKNIDYRFTILGPNQSNAGRRQNQSLQRNQNTPFPYSVNAVETIAYSFSASEKGADSWYDVVKRNVNSALTTFISANALDYLTAPRQDEQNPRLELRIELFAAAVSETLRRAGTELHWMDIGQFDIDNLQENKEQDPVDQARTKLWAARLVGDANAIRSDSDAKHLAYQEIARSEAQAEIINSITDALRDTDFGTNRTETLRHIFLVRTAQILEALRKTRKDPPAP